MWGATITNGGDDIGTEIKSVFKIFSLHYPPFAVISRVSHPWPSEKIRVHYMSEIREDENTSTLCFYCK